MKVLSHIYWSAKSENRLLHQPMHPALEEDVKDAQSNGDGCVARQGIEKHIYCSVNITCFELRTPSICGGMLVEQFSGTGIVSVSMKLAGHAVMLARHNKKGRFVLLTASSF